MKANKIFSRVLKYTGVLALVLAVVGGTIGYLVDGSNGLISALLGTAVAVVFAGITAGSLIAAIKFDIIAFFGIVMGSWLLKMVLFIIALVLLRDQPFINTIVLFIAMIAAIVGSVGIDALVVYRARMAYVSDVALPEPAPKESE